MRSKTAKPKISVNSQFKEINACRAAWGLPLIVEKKRNCLVCNTMFYSQGPGHRLCLECSHKDYMYAEEANVRS